MSPLEILDIKVEFGALQRDELADLGEARTRSYHELIKRAREKGTKLNEYK